MTKTAHSTLLDDYLDDIRLAAAIAPVLDLACGSGRNGLFLVEQSVPVCFCDINPESLSAVEQRLDQIKAHHLGTTWQVDLERPETQPLRGLLFGGIIIYNYLHRSLFDQIMDATVPGGLVVYETFTVDQPQFGRPNNPEFLLRHNELQDIFSDWQILYYFEGVIDGVQSSGRKAIARIVARKPQRE